MIVNRLPVQNINLPLYFDVKNFSAMQVALGHELKMFNPWALSMDFKKRFNLHEAQHLMSLSMQNFETLSSHQKMICMSRLIRLCEIFAVLPNKTFKDLKNVLQGALRDYSSKSYEIFRDQFKILTTFEQFNFIQRFHGSGRSISSLVKRDPLLFEQLIGSLNQTQIIKINLLKDMYGRTPLMTYLTETQPAHHCLPIQTFLGDSRAQGKFKVIQSKDNADDSALSLAIEHEHYELIRHEFINGLSSAQLYTLYSPLSFYSATPLLLAVICPDKRLAYDIAHPLKQSHLFKLAIGHRGHDSLMIWAVSQQNPLFLQLLIERLDGSQLFKLSSRHGLNGCTPLEYICSSQITSLHALLPSLLYAMKGCDAIKILSKKHHHKTLAMIARDAGNDNLATALNNIFQQLPSQKPLTFSFKREVEKVINDLSQPSLSNRRKSEKLSYR